MLCLKGKSSRVLWTVALLTTLLFFLPSSPVNCSEADMPAEAQKALIRGLAAAEQQAWDHAIKYFMEAFNKAPLAPQVSFNLGLAHARSRNEVPAFIWWQAYLALAPDAANRAAIEQEIVKLEVATEIKRDTLFEKAVAAALALPEKKRRQVSHDVAQDLCRAGKVDGAAKIYMAGFDYTPRPEEEPRFRQRCYYIRASKLLALGNPEAMLEIVALAAENMQADLLADAATYYLKAGQPIEAEKVLQRVAKVNDKNSILQSFVLHYLKQGDEATAGRVLQQLQPGKAKNEVLKSMVAHYLNKYRYWNQVDGISKAVPLAEQMTDGTEKLETWLDMAIAQGIKNDVAGAKSSINKALQYQGEWDSNHKARLGEARALIADFKGAMEMINQVSEYQKQKIYSSMVTAYLRQGDVKKAKQMAERIPAKNSSGRTNVRKSSAMAEIGEWLAKNRTEAEALKAARNLQWSPFEPNKRGVILEPFVKEAVRAGQLDRALALADQLKGLDNGQSYSRNYLYGQIIVTYIELGQLDKALELAQSFKLRKLLGTMESVFIELAKALAEQKKYTQSLDLILENKGMTSYGSFTELTEELIASGQGKKTAEVLHTLVSQAKSVWVATVLEVVDQLIDNNLSQAALPVLQALERHVLKRADMKELDGLLDRYRLAGDAASAEKLASYAKALTWFDLAKKTKGIGDMSPYLQDLKSAKLEEVLRKLAKTAARLANDLELVQFNAE